MNLAMICNQLYTELEMRGVSAAGVEIRLPRDSFLKLISSLQEKAEREGLGIPDQLERGDALLMLAGVKFKWMDQA